MSNLYQHKTSGLQLKFAWYQANLHINDLVEFLRQHASTVPDARCTVLEQYIQIALLKRGKSGLNYKRPRNQLTSKNI